MNRSQKRAIEAQKFQRNVGTYESGGDSLNTVRAEGVMLERQANDVVGTKYSIAEGGNGRFSHDAVGKDDVFEILGQGAYKVAQIGRLAAFVLRQTAFSNEDGVLGNFTLAYLFKKVFGGGQRHGFNGGRKSLDFRLR